MFFPMCIVMLVIFFAVVMRGASRDHRKEKAMFKRGDWVCLPHGVDGADEFKVGWKGVVNNIENGRAEVFMQFGGAVHTDVRHLATCDSPYAKQNNGLCGDPHDCVGCNHCVEDSE
jgi:hypothetical protein